MSFLTAFFFSLCSQQVMTSPFIYKLLYKSTFIINSPEYSSCLVPQNHLIKGKVTPCENNLLSRNQWKELVVTTRHFDQYGLGPISWLCVILRLRPGIDSCALQGSVSAEICGKQCHKIGPWSSSGEYTEGISLIMKIHKSIIMRNYFI